MIVDRDMNGHRGAKIHSCKWDVSSSSYMFQSLSRFFQQNETKEGPKMVLKSKQKRSHSRSFQVLSYWWYVLDGRLLKTPIVLPLFSFLTPYLALTLRYTSRILYAVNWVIIRGWCAGRGTVCMWYQYPSNCGIVVLIPSPINLPADDHWPETRLGCFID